MKKLISWALTCLVLVSLSVGGVVANFTYHTNLVSAASVVKDFKFHDENYDRDVKVEIYERASGESEHNPVFAICELVNQSIDYRKEHPEQTDMTIDCSFYRVERDTACYYKKGDKNYGKMTVLKNQDYTDNCERVLYSFIKAAKYGIYTKIMWHIAVLKDGTKVADYFNDYMDESCIFDSTKQVKDFLEIRCSTWENAGISQMHNKQLLVSHYKDYDGKEYQDTIFTSTSNIDYYSATNNLPISYKDWSHTGFTVSNHPYVYGSNKRYFDVCFDNAYNRYEFASKVFELHDKGDYLDGGLNYADENFECYFTPLSQSQSANLYDDTNPVARYIEKLNSCNGRIECFLNQYSLNESQTDPLISKCLERIYDAFSNNKTRGNKFGLVANGSFTKDCEIAQKLLQIGDITTQKMTHTKDSIFYFGDSDEYVVITGSTNWSFVNFFGQSNTLMVFKEQGSNHQIYNAFKNNYYKTMGDRI